MFGLLKISSNTVIEKWDVIPQKFDIKEIKCVVFCADKNGTLGDYKIVPISNSSINTG